MSSYADFFYCHDNELISIDSFTRGSYLYELALGNGAPYGHGKVLNHDKILEMLREAKQDIEQYNKRIEDHERTIKVISGFTDPIYDKLEAIDMERDDIDALRESIEEIKYAISFLTFLDTMIDNVRYNSDDKKVDYQKYIYYGIEVPSRFEDWEE